MLPSEIYAKLTDILVEEFLIANQNLKMSTTLGGEELFLDEMDGDDLGDYIEDAFHGVKLDDADIERLRSPDTTLEQVVKIISAKMGK